MTKKALEEQTADELRDYIRNELRAEAKALREENETFKSAFSAFRGPEQRGLLHIISTFGENREAGASLFRELSDTVLGPVAPAPPTPEEEDDMSDKETQTDDSEMPAWAKALNEKVDALINGSQASAEAEEADAIREIKAEATSLGFTEGTEEWVTFFKIAASDLADGDLAVAKDMYTKLHGDPAGETKDPEPEPEPEAKEDPKPKAAFPKTGAAGGAGAPDAKAGKEEPLDLSKAGVSKAALAYMNSALNKENATP